MFIGSLAISADAMVVKPQRRKRDANEHLEELKVTRESLKLLVNEHINFDDKIGNALGMIKKPQGSV